MSLSFASWIARRYLGSRHAGRFAPLLTVTAVASIAVGVLALVIIMSVMRGFKRELTDRLLGFNAHITLSRDTSAEELSSDQVQTLLSRAGATLRDVAPFVQGEVIAVSSASGELTAQGARVRGIDPNEMGAIGGISLYLPEGTADLSQALLSSGKGGVAGAVIGSEIVGQLMVHPDFEDVIELTAPLAELTPAGELAPNRVRVRVSGIFRAGLFDYDSKYILLSLDTAQKLLGEQAQAGWHIRLTRAIDAPAVIQRLVATLPSGWRAEGVDAQNSRLFAALALERLAMSGILLMVLIIASCSIAGVVMLMVAAKRRDIAILQSIGLTRSRVRGIFVLNAGLIGGCGSLIGLFLGLGICAAIEHWPIPLPDSYYLDVLPVDLDYALSIVFALMGTVVAMLASLVPVRAAARTSPVGVLRYE